MPATSNEIPNTFRYVMRRYDRNATLALRFVCYGENTVSRSIELNGVIAPTIFLNTAPARDRAKKLGWKDETDEFLKKPNEITRPDKKTPRKRKKSK